MEQKIFAAITSYEGLTNAEKGLIASVGQDVFTVKQVILDGDKFKAVCNVGLVEVAFDSDNVKLYRTYGDDIKVYDPLTEGDLIKPKQSGE